MLLMFSEFVFFSVSVKPLWKVLAYFSMFKRNGERACAPCGAGREGPQESKSENPKREKILRGAEPKPKGAASTHTS